MWRITRGFGFETSGDDGGRGKVEGEDQVPVDGVMDLTMRKGGGGRISPGGLGDEESTNDNHETDKAPDSTNSRMIDCEKSAYANPLQSTRDQRSLPPKPPPAPFPPLNKNAPHISPPPSSVSPLPTSTSLVHAPSPPPTAPRPIPPQHQTLHLP